MSKETKNDIVSILVPVYNADKYLGLCLDSILSQTFSNLQVVLIDDGSKDNSLQVCMNYAANDLRVEVYHQENCGVAETRNHLLEKVKGDYVLFVDADDWIEPDMVEYMYSLAQMKGSDFVMCDRVMNYTVPSVKQPGVYELSQLKAIEDFLRHDYFIGSLWNKLFASSLLQNESFNSDISYGEDALFCWRVLQKVSKVVVSDRQLYHYRENPESISNQTFGEKKMSGHKTWTLLTSEVEKKWPQFSKIVRGTFARSDFYLLQAASQGGYPKDDNIKMLQANIRLNYKYLKQQLKQNRKQLFYATVIMHWYGFGRLYYRLYQLKKGI